MATAEKTFFYSDRFSKVRYKKLGKTNYQTSICGFGSYRVDFRISNHEEAMKYALLNGINLIDTSSNYSDGGSEILVGNVINNLIKSNEFQRDEFIIVSKAGYIQGRNLQLAQDLEKNNTPFSDVVKCTPDLWHSVSPDFLEKQITLSLERLRLTKIDVFLLHNPEYFLTYSSEKDIEILRNEYYNRIEKAFIQLEKEVEKGRINFYGISSNTFILESEKRSFTSLERILEITNKISANNHFAVIQFPLNLMETGAVSAKNQLNNSITVLELAHKNNIGILINRPLNAIKDSKIRRLADFKIKEDRKEKEIIILINDLIELEDKIRKEFILNISNEEPTKSSILENFAIALIIKSNMNKFSGINHFKDIKKQYLIPLANRSINDLFKLYPQDELLIDKLNRFAVNVNIILDSIESLLAQKANNENKEIHDMINMLPDTPLSQKAILMINSIKEVSSTLVGMRSVNYVNDVLDSMQYDHVKNINELWNNFSK